MRISDWSSDVCSSDLLARADQLVERRSRNARELDRRGDADADRFARQGLEFGTYRRRGPFVILGRRPLGHDFIRERMKVRSLSRKAANIAGTSAATGSSSPKASSAERRGGKQGVRTCGTRWARKYYKKK